MAENTKSKLEDKLAKDKVADNEMDDKSKRTAANTDSKKAKTKNKAKIMAFSSENTDFTLFIFPPVNRTLLGEP